MNTYILFNHVLCKKFSEKCSAGVTDLGIIWIELVHCVVME